MVTRRFVVRQYFLTLAGMASLCVVCQSAAAESTEVVRSGRIESDTVWRGRNSVTGAIDVAVGARLSIESPAEVVFQDESAGLSIAGVLTIVGTLESPVILRGFGAASGSWNGIQLTGNGANAVIDNVEMRGAAVGVAAIGARLTLGGAIFTDCSLGVMATAGAGVGIKNATFERCRAAVTGDKDARVSIAGARFRECEKGVFFGSGAAGELRESAFYGGKLGVEINQGNSIAVSGNNFTDVATGIELYQCGPGVRVEGNRFEKTRVGVIVTNYSSPVLRCNRFISSETAVMAQRFCAPEVRNNDFVGSTMGFAAGLKSNAVLADNTFTRNAQAVFADWSSYPIISRNNFVDNVKDVVLGRFMSADWEDRVGSGGISRDRAEKSGSRHIDGVGVPVKTRGVVDARANWWGPKTTAEMKRLGGDADIPTIVDFHDLGAVSYQGFGEERYRIDTVLYQPWESASVPDAGADSPVCLPGRSEGKPAE